MPGLYFVAPDGVFAVTSGCDLLCEMSTISNICAVELVQQLKQVRKYISVKPENYSYPLQSLVINNVKFG